MHRKSGAHRGGGMCQCGKKACSDTVIVNTIYFNHCVLFASENSNVLNPQLISLLFS